MRYAEPIERLVKALSRLPGIGEKTATRLALYILNSSREYVDELAKDLLEVKGKVKLCSGCMGFTEKDPCRICGIVDGVSAVSASHWDNVFHRMGDGDGPTHPGFTQLDFYSIRAGLWIESGCRSVACLAATRPSCGAQSRVRVDVGRDD